MLEATKAPTRDAVPVEYTWDLTKIFPSDEAWAEAVKKLEALLPEVRALQGTLTRDAASLLHGMKVIEEARRQLEWLYVYANQRKDSDTTAPAGQALEMKAASLGADTYAAMAFFEPEVLTLSEATIRAWMDELPALRVYDFALRELLRTREHIRSAEVENVMAQYSEIVRAPGDIYGALLDSDLTYPEVEDEFGNKTGLSNARLVPLLRNKDQRVRRDAFKNYYTVLKAHRNTFGASLAAAVRSHIVNARLRNYTSALEAALKPNDIPLDVYRNLIATVNQNLPRLHHYMELRKRILGVSELHYYDVYVSLVSEFDMKFTYPEAATMVQEAFRPLGQEYTGAMAHAFTDRWIDVYENVGKRSGAYSGGAYLTPPYILMNYQNQLDDVFTLAHELGHSMHTYFAHRNQPYVYSGYTIFVAEVASTLNEALLTAHILRTTDNAALRKHLIVQQLEDIRTTLIRQTMFAEFELDLHQRSEAGEALTTDSVTERYFDLLKRYHGPVMTWDDEAAVEWMRIPHFYYNFYVFQYATGLSAALALSEQILSEGAPAVERYLNFLKGGSSKPSIELLRGAGVDMTTPQPVQKAMDNFEALLSELERTL